MKTPKTAIATAALALALSPLAFAGDPVDDYLISAGFLSAPTEGARMATRIAVDSGDAADQYLVDAGFKDAPSAVCRIAADPVGGPRPPAVLDPATHYLVESGFMDTPDGYARTGARPSILVATGASVFKARAC